MWICSGFEGLLPSKKVRNTHIGEAMRTGTRRREGQVHSRASLLSQLKNGFFKSTITCCHCLFYNYIVCITFTLWFFFLKSCHWGGTFSKGTNMYHLGTNNIYFKVNTMHPIGVNNIQRRNFWKGTAPVTDFVPFFCLSVNSNLKLLHA